MGSSPMGTTPDLSVGKSALVMTAFTPGRASAADASIDLMRACACGLRRTLPCSMPGKLISAPYRARPVTLSTPSCRIGRVPITLNLCSCTSILTSLASPRRHPSPHAQFCHNLCTDTDCLPVRSEFHVQWDWDFCRAILLQTPGIPVYKSHTAMLHVQETFVEADAGLRLSPSLLQFRPFSHSPRVQTRGMNKQGGHQGLRCTRR